MDELAKLYIRVRGDLYRIKVFEVTLTIERQPGGSNLMVNRADYPVYDDVTTSWDYEVLTRLIEGYQWSFAGGKNE